MIAPSPHHLTGKNFHPRFSKIRASSTPIQAACAEPEPAKKQNKKIPPPQFQVRPPLRHALTVATRSFHDHLLLHLEKPRYIHPFPSDPTAHAYLHTRPVITFFHKKSNRLPPVHPRRVREQQRSSVQRRPRLSAVGGPLLLLLPVANIKHTALSLPTLEALCRKRARYGSARVYVRRPVRDGCRAQTRALASADRVQSPTTYTEEVVVVGRFSPLCRSFLARPWPMKLRRSMPCCESGWTLVGRTFGLFASRINCEQCPGTREVSGY